MKRAGRILVVDDLEKWRNVLSDVLVDGGYEVDTAASVNEALDRLQENLYHVLVLDIRMVDQDDTNVEGMSFLSMLDDRGLLPAVDIIMLSAYGNREQMRTSFRDYTVADFQTKEDFSGRAFLSDVNEIFDGKMHIRLDLDIHWQDASGPEQAISGIWAADKRIKADIEPALQKRVAGELEDLFCRLFHEAHSVLARPLVPGMSGTGVLWVQPFRKDGAAQPVIVKFGDYRTIDEEYRNYKAHVEPFIGGGRRTNVLDLRRTPLLGGIVYSLLGTSSEQVESFDQFYRRAGMTQLRTVLDRLFDDTCGRWYANLGELTPIDLTEDYQHLLGFTAKNLHEGADRLKSIQREGHLKVDDFREGSTLPNPIPAATQQHLVRVTYQTITHGDLNPTNVLVDEDGHTWLIDFLRTGKGHILRDIAELDTAVRIQLLAPNEATLVERLRMEEALLQCNIFSRVGKLVTNFPTENQALAKAYATSVHLRRLAQKRVMHNPADDISEYYIASMYYALNLVRFYSLPKLQREHALLAAALLAERLELKA